MKALALAAVVLVPSGLVSGLGAPLPLPDLDHADCLRADRVEMRFINLLEFLPWCIVVDSGATVTWAVGGGQVEHDPGSIPDGGECFRALHELGRRLRSDDTYALRFDYDGERATATHTHASDCSFALDPDTTAEQAVIEYRCYDHPWARGTILVRA